MADQRKLRQKVGLENINTTPNYVVTNNAHQIQMKSYINELKPRERFLRTPLVSTVWLVQYGENVINYLASPPFPNGKTRSETTYIASNWFGATNHCPEEDSYCQHLAVCGYYFEIFSFFHQFFNFFN